MELWVEIIHEIPSATYTWSFNIVIEKNGKSGLGVIVVAKRGNKFRH